MGHCPRCNSDVMVRHLCRTGNEVYEIYSCAICGYSNEDNRKKTYVYGSK